MSRGFVALVLLVGALAAAAAYARYEVALVFLLRDAEIVLVGEEVAVEEVEGWRVATLKVAATLRGESRQAVRFLAEPTWTCDTSRAEVGQKVLLLLTAADSKEASLGRGKGPIEVDGQPILRIAGYGRGRLRISTVDGVEVATYYQGQVQSVDDLAAIVERFDSLGGN